ncbi:MAG: hypothetical protein LBS45_09625 [Synergistaceae bacterium]|jgi:hypothetical protein|nr:hypothetical protein [Synergistaceae bacterium]
MLLGNWLGEESYIQVFGTGVLITGGTTVVEEQEELFYEEDDEENTQVTKSSGGGCDAGMLAVVAIAVGAGALSLGKTGKTGKKRKG